MFSISEGFRGETGGEFGCYDECTGRHWWGGCHSHRRVCPQTGFRFNYKCCRGEMKNPTAFPIAHPTHKPIANPTNEPIANPTVHPVSEPTTAPNRDKEIALEKAAAAEAQRLAEEAAAELAELVKKQAELERIEMEKAAEAAAAVAAAEKAAVEEKAAAEEADKKRMEEAHAAKEAADKEAAAALKEQEDAIKAAHAAEEKIREEQAALIKANEEEAKLDALAVLRASTLACPFMFKQGVSKVEVPAGCVFFATNDVTFDKQKEEQSPAVYFCTKEENLVLQEADFTKYGLQHSVSYIQPGKDASVAFFSDENLKGQSAVFTSNNHMPLNSYKFKDGSMANDRVKSASVRSSTQDIPKSCNDLHFSPSMKLDRGLMKKDGIF